LGENLISEGNNFVPYAAFQNNISSDVISTNDPLLGPLAENGGPTATHAVLRGSPALDTGDDTLTDTDQRGRPRLSGAHADIGPFEFQVPTPPLLSGLPMLTNGAFQFTFTNTSDGTFIVLATTNVFLPATQWFNLGPATLITNGLHRFSVPATGSSPNLFFQLRWP
jgi:hypothetical protein